VAICGHGRRPGAAGQQGLTMGRERAANKLTHSAAGDGHEKNKRSSDVGGVDREAAANAHRRLCRQGPTPRSGDGASERVRAAGGR
jgi:hypothetical protein